MPFQLGGGGSNSGSPREARQRTLHYALANAARRREEQYDTGGFGTPEVVTRSAGLSQKSQSPTFESVGGFGEFGQDAKDPKNRKYFQEVMGGLASFQDFMNPPQGPPA